MYLEALDDAIAMHLHKTGKTQGEFAAEMGMSENTFSWKRNGRNGKEFKASELVKLCDALEVDFFDIMAEQRDKYGWPPPDEKQEAEAV